MVVSRRARDIKIASPVDNEAFLACKATGKDALFSASDRKILWKTAMLAALQAWVDEYLPKRFTVYVRRAPFNYNAGWKGGNPLPLVEWGKLREESLATAGVVVRATGNGALGRIGFSVPAYVDQSRKVSMRGVLEMIPQSEADVVAEQIAAIFVEAAGDSEYSRSRRGRERLTLREE